MAERVFYFRHGVQEDGSSDADLLREGMEQVAATGARTLRNYGPGAVEILVTSTLPRAVASGRILSEELGDKTAYGGAFPELNESLVRTRNMTDSEYGAHYQRMLTDPEYKPNGAGQSPRESATRVQEIIDFFEGQAVGIVGHSGIGAFYLQDPRFVRPHPRIQALSRVGRPLLQEVLPPGSRTVLERPRPGTRYVVVELGVKGKAA